MIDGIYNVKARTPLGAKAGQLVMATTKNKCAAELTIAGKTKHLEGTLKGETVTFEGSVHLPFPFGKVSYVLEGTVRGDELVGKCRTKKFNFDVQGTRVA